MSSKGGSNLLAFIVGAAAGAAVGILYAPEKGINTRDKLRYKLDKYKEQLQELIDDLLEEEGEESVSEARNKSQMVISDAIKHAEQLMSEVDALKKQITTREKTVEE
ncbi:YtxH domain-containing protein [Flammeovirgaceae bacterium SG7u.111]|nr:YtxH domain-containing protein [Flammeovirgaceae bacterium SG7u.132]WPO35519.1 YtxH domain-containing protein [Flammeovirgaceae bacterium SG7u.111]